MNLFGFGFFLVGRLLIIVLILEFVIGLFRDLIFFWFSFGRVYVLRNLFIFFRFFSLFV